MRALGAWGNGAFEDDAAMDWAFGLDEADASSRTQMIDYALRAAVASDDYLEQPVAAEAIAAAAVVAQLHSGVVPQWSGPRFLAQGERVEIDDGLIELSARALDRVVGDQSEWRELWEDAGELDDARAMVRDLKGRLS